MMAPKTFKDFVEEARQSGVPEVTAEELKQRLDDGVAPLIIDVRDPDEWQKGTLPNALKISKGKLELKIGEVIPDENTEMVLYCGGGSRSLLASKSLREMGYANAKSLAGGFRGWKELTGTP